MRKILMMLAAVLCCWVTTAVLTACSSDNDDNPATGVDGRIVGEWYADVSGKTYAKWNYGKCWQVTELKVDGTGSTDIYYLNDDEPVAREHNDFTYTAAEESTLTKGMQKADADMAEKFDKWSKTEDMIPVPQPAKFTVFVYGNAGGTMDNAIEDGFWAQAKEFLKDHNNVRVVCLYKYGKDLPEAPFSGKYAAPGDIVWFELTSETDLDKIKDEGMQAIGMGQEAIEMKICDPKTLKMFMEFSSLACPAKEYVFGVWGHGSGLVPMKDIPGKYELAPSATRGVMYDEWNNDEELDMYEFREAIKASGIDRLNTIFFHNCMMGNLETVTTVNDCADYICCSAHVLSSDGEVLTEFVRGLVDKGNAEDAVAQMFESITPSWQNGYGEGGSNGDFKMYRTDKFTPILDAAKHLADRLIALYPTQKEAIDRATSKVYRYVEFQRTYIYPFFDIADYAHLLAQETGDAQMKTIADEMDNAFKQAIIHYRDVNWSKEHLDHYTLSVCLVNSILYNYQKCKEDLDPSYLCNFNEGYEQCDFHKYTGWGNWLRINEQQLNHNPQCGGGGPLE